MWCTYKSGSLVNSFSEKTFYNFEMNILNQKGESSRSTMYDTVISINVLEHVQNALEYLQELHKSLHVGGILIFHDTAQTDLGMKPHPGPLYHPIQLKAKILEIFFENFERIYFEEGNVTAESESRIQFYFLGRKQSI